MKTQSRNPKWQEIITSPKTEEHKLKIKEANIGRHSKAPRTEATKKLISKNMKLNSLKAKVNLSKSLIKLYNTPSTSEDMMANIKTRIENAVPTSKFRAPLLFITMVEDVAYFDIMAFEYYCQKLNFSMEEILQLERELGIKAPRLT